MDYFGYIATGLVIIWFGYRLWGPSKGLTSLNTQQFAEQSRNQLLIDVREVHEFKQGSIKKAKNIPLSELHARLSEIPKDQSVYLFCRSGMRSKKAGSILAKAGYNQLFHLSGGLLRWKGVK